MEEKKILIGCPTYQRYRYCIDAYLEAVRKLEYKNYDLLLVDNSPDDSFLKELRTKGVNAEHIEYCEPARERIVRSRNILRERAIEGNYDYFLSLEQDVIATPDLLKRLISHNKDIVTAYYGNDVMLTLKSKSTGQLKKMMINLPLIYVKGDTPGKIRRANPQEVLHKGTIEVGGMGVGCVLISTEALKKIRFRYDNDKDACDDMNFCHDAKEAGHRLYLDSDLIVKHLHKEWGNIKR